MSQLMCANKFVGGNKFYKIYIFSLFSKFKMAHMSYHMGHSQVTPGNSTWCMEDIPILLSPINWRRAKWRQVAPLDATWRHVPPLSARWHQ